MRAVVQKVSKAAVEIEGKITGKIQTGLLVLLGIGLEDNEGDAQWLAKKICNLRIFSNPEEEGTLSLLDIQGGMLVISQFTLFGSTKKGTRPSYHRAAKPDQAIPLYETFMKECEKLLSAPVERGVFGAMMKVSLDNEGPVTLVIDTKDKE